MAPDIRPTIEDYADIARERFDRYVEAAQTGTAAEYLAAKAAWEAAHNEVGRIASARENAEPEVLTRIPGGPR